jgi:hypothetical protein
MEEAPENGKESSHSAHANGMTGMNLQLFAWFMLLLLNTVHCFSIIFETSHLGAGSGKPDYELW